MKSDEKSKGDEPNSAQKRIWADDAGVPRVLSKEESARYRAILDKEKEGKGDGKSGYDE